MRARQRNVSGSVTVKLRVEADGSVGSVEILQAEPDYRLKPQDIDQIYVRSDTGSMIPLSALVSAGVYGLIGWLTR